MKTKIAGQLITSLSEFDEYCSKNPSIWVKYWSKPSPTSFVISMQYRLIKRWIENKVFFTVKNIENETSEEQKILS